MPETLRILLSGPGLVGRKHARLLQDHAEAMLAGIVAPETARNAAFAAACGVPLFQSVDAALARDRFDAVILSSPNQFHHAQAMACLKAGLPTFIEKPLAPTLAQAADITAEAERRGVPVLVGHHRTHSPLLSVARAFLRSPAFGRMVSVHGSALFHKPRDYFDAGPWRTRLGGGPILINLVHEIGLLRHLVGEIRSVSASVSHAARGFEVEDTAAIAFTFEGGALGSFMLSDAAASSKSWEMTAGEDPMFPNFADQDCYHFAGDMGSLDFPSMRTRTYLGAAKRSWWGPFVEDRLAIVRRDPLAMQMDHFIAVARGEAQPLVTARDGYLNLVALEAIVRAAAERRTVDVAEVLEQPGRRAPRRSSSRFGRGARTP